MARTPSTGSGRSPSLKMPIGKHTVVQHSDLAAAHSRLATKHATAAAAGARDARREQPKSKRT
jgi:hypothetical protein